MILETFKMRGVSDPFRHREVDLDFRGIPKGSIIAFVGANGEGKSHVLELLCPGTLDRELPFYRDPKAKRGESIASHVHPDVRDAYVETVYRLALGLVTFRINIDGKRQKMEPYVTTSWDARIVGPMQKEVDEVRAKLFPSRAALLSGPFACQGGYDGFFRLGPSERKAIFLEMLGVEHLEAEAQIAHEWGKAVLAALGRVRENLTAVGARAERAEVLNRVLAELAPRLATAEAKVAGAAEARDAAQATLAEAERALAAAHSAAVHTAKEGERLTSLHDDTVSRRDGIIQRLGELTALLMDAAEIRAAESALPGIDAAIAQRDAERAQYQAQLAPVVEVIATRDAELQQRTDRHRVLAAELAAAEQAARDVAASTIEQEVATKTATATALAAEITGLETASAALERAAADEASAHATRQRLLLRRRDLEPRTTLLAQIPNVPACATCPLTADAHQSQKTLADVTAELAALPPVTIDDGNDGDPEDWRLWKTPAGEARRLHAEAIDTNRRAHRDLERWTAAQQTGLVRLGVLRETASKVAVLRTERDENVLQGTEVRTALDAAKAERERIVALDATAATQRRDLQDRRAELAPKAAKRAEIAVAETQQAELERQRDSADAAIAEAEAALAALPASEVDTATARVTDASAALTTARTTYGMAEIELRAVRDERAKLAGERQALGDPATEAAALEAREAKLIVEAADWAVLERGLGKSGVQAMIIDAAGPEVSALGNDLLATCYTPRFQIQLTTTRPRADGRGVTEVFEARILDAEAGRDGTHGSGGETALIDAALRLATVIVNTRRSGFEVRTLWLDEATSALSEENAPKYVAMIRRAMEIGGFHHCFLVSHQREIYEAADVTFNFANGRVSRDGQEAALAAA